MTSCVCYDQLHDHPIHLLFWPVCWPPEWYFSLLTCSMTTYSSYNVDLQCNIIVSCDLLHDHRYSSYNSDLFVDSDLNVDLLCDIVVSCYLPHDHLFLIQLWPVCWFWHKCWPPVWHCCIPLFLWPPIPHTIQTCMLSSCVALLYLVTCSMIILFFIQFRPDVDSDLNVDLLCDIVVLVTCCMTILFLIQFWPVCWLWPDNGHPVGYCFILWPAPPIPHASLTCTVYNSDLYVDSDLNVDLLCDIVVSCDLLHDHPILQIDWPNCTHVGIYDRKFRDKPWNVVV